MKSDQLFYKQNKEKLKIKRFRICRNTICITPQADIRMIFLLLDWLLFLNQ